MAQSDRFLRALLRQPVDCTPVWIMRQAGRYLPEYRATRAKAGDFLNLCKTPELACEITLQPLARFDLDAAIIFSDILTIPDAMGLGLRFSTGEGPQFANPIRSANDIQRLQCDGLDERLAYVSDAIRLTRRELNDRVPLIGFAGSPWTLATYMVEGGSSKNFSLIKAMLYRDPQLLHQLLQILAVSTIQYLNAQIQAGAQAIMLFDTWGGILTPSAYQIFSLAYMRTILQGLIREQAGQTIPTIIFTKGGGQWLTLQTEAGSNAIGLDWMTNINTARQQIGHQVALQGNMDPSLLLAEPTQIRAGVNEILQAYGHGPGHIFNLGHGITPDVPPEHVAILVDAVHELSLPYHTST